MKLNKMQKKILKKMGLKPTKKTYEKLTEKQRYRYNTHRQKMVGKKKYDYIEITEPGSFNRALHKYKNIKEWDKRNFDFQEKWMLKESKRRIKAQKKAGQSLDKPYVKKEYKSLYIKGDWFRFLEKRKYFKRRLIYGMIESASSYVLIQALDELDEMIDAHIPNMIVDNSHKRDKKTGLTTVEFQTRAAGREKELRRLQDRKRDMVSEMEKDIEIMVEPLSGYTFKKEDEDKVDGLDIYVIGGLKAAEEISFRDFVKGFAQREQPFGVLENLVERVVERYGEKLFE